MDHHWGQVRAPSLQHPSPSCRSRRPTLQPTCVSSDPPLLFRVHDLMHSDVRPRFGIVTGLGPPYPRCPEWLHESQHLRDTLPRFLRRMQDAGHAGATLVPVPVRVVSWLSPGVSRPARTARAITSAVGTAATSGFMRRSSEERGGDAHPTAGGQGVQCESLQLRRVGGVPVAGEALGFGASFRQRLMC